MTKEKGILIIALGHPNYGRMALNLAISLKFSSGLPIALAYNESGISQIKNSLDKFDELIEVPQKYYSRKGNTEFIKAKTFIYKLSPFSETIYLDADMLWLPRRPIDVLFDELKDINLAIQSRGSTDLNTDIPNKSYWRDLKEYKSVYGGDKFYSLSSEFIYFKKNKENEKFFNDSIKIYDNLKISHTVFGGGIPDELIFNISMLQNEIVPFKEVFVPIYWEQAERKNLQPGLMYSQYFGYSVGGNQYSNIEKKFYDNLSQFYGTRSGVHYFKLKDKMKYLPERTQI